MRNFMKYIFATAIGTFFGFCFCILMLVVLISGMATLGSSLTKKSVLKINKDSVLVLSLEEPIKERSDEWSILFGSYRYPTLRQITQAIDFASQDDRIKGIFLNMSNTTHGWSTLKSIRESVEKFKLSEKFVYAYSDFYDEKSYYFSSVADQVFIHPKGEMALDGISSTPVFFKNLFSKLGVKPLIFRVGKYKSAIEPFIQTEMSESNRSQTSELVDDIWQEALSSIAIARKIETQEIEKMVQHLEVRTAEEALEKGLVDDLKSRSEIFETLLVEKSSDEIKRKDLEKLVGISGYLSANRSELNPDGVGFFSVEDLESSKDNDLIGIINIEGAIMSGKSAEETVGSDDVISQIQKAKYNKNIKGVIVRVNSPGGSALASDVIWTELQRLREVKPVYASFGDIAASGGYYIGVAAEKIYAHPNTITGSIGVYSILFDMQKGANEKLGLNFDRVVTHQYADRGSSVRDMTSQEARLFQEDTNRVYQRFVEVVQSGRQFSSFDEVHALAQGRVWSGTQAQQLGLVDELGNLEDVIAIMAEELKLSENYRAVEIRSEIKFSTLFGGWVFQPYFSIFPEEIRLIAETLFKNKLQAPFHFIEKDRIWALAPYYRM